MAEGLHSIVVDKQQEEVVHTQEADEDKFLVAENNLDYPNSWNMPVDNCKLELVLRIAEENTMVAVDTNRISVEEVGLEYRNKWVMMLVEAERSFVQSAVDSYHTETGEIYHLGSRYLADR